MTEIKDLEALVEELEIEACRLEEEGRPIAAACNRNRAKYERSKIELLGLKSTASACEGGDLFQGCAICQAVTEL